MSSIQQLMAADHKRCDDLLMQVEAVVAKGDWETAQKQLADFDNAMQAHFNHEENILFPAFETASGNTTGPTMMMRQEHDDMRELLSAMDKAAKEKDGNRYLGLAETLLIFMQQHNMKEEQILYPMIDSNCAQQADELMQTFHPDTNSDAAWMSREILLEVHELQAPQPMQLTLDALDQLQPGEYIKMVHRMQPFPLYKILDENGFRYRVKNSEVSAFDIYIWHAKDKETEQFIKQV